MINFFIGLVVLLISATVFLEIMQTISAKWKLSPLLVSLVIVGLGTNLPELVVTISSLTHHDPGLAFGNLVGSSIINLSLIFGLAVVAGHVKIGNHKTQKNALVLLGVTLLFIALRFSPIPNAIQAVLLLLALGGSLGYEYWLGVQGRKHEDKNLITKMVKVEKKKHHYPAGITTVAFILSLVGLIFGGSLTVTAIESLAVIWGISTTVLGLTLTSISTSLPELITILLAEKHENNKVVVGTLLGSNLFNLTLFPAIILFNTSLRSILPISDLLFLLAITLAFVFVLFRYRLKEVTHRMGIGLLVIFLIFALSAATS